MRILLGILLLLGLVGPATAQRDLPSPLGWHVPAEPFHIVGPIHFVGTRGLAAYLIETRDGLILLDGGMPWNASDYEASIRKLGFRPEDIRLLLTTHAHFDHTGTMAHFRKLSNALVAVMKPDVEHLASGGRTDPVYKNTPLAYFPEVIADIELNDRNTITLGEVTMRARLGAGHAPGATTWTTTVKDRGRRYKVVFPNSTSVNPSIGPIPGHRLANPPSYPRIVNDFRDTFEMLEARRPDIWLGAHTETFCFASKRARALKEGPQAWVDPEGYRIYVAAEKAKFEAILAKQEGRPVPAKEIQLLDCNEPRGLKVKTSGKTI